MNRLTIFFINKKNNFSNWASRIKRAELASVIISALVSAIAELFRQSFLILYSNGFLLDQKFLDSFHEQRINIFHSIFNIFLITAIVWCITGIISMLKSGEARKSQLLSLAVLLMFAFSVAWYSCEILIVLNWTKFYVTLSLVTLLYTLLFMFFCYDRETKNQETSDHVISAQLP